ncbi:MAG: DUF456 domain-containing protein [Halobacteria archaeon]
MAEFALVVTFLLLLAGIAGTVVPVLPGVALSFAGVFLYWWSTGYTDPSLVFVAGVFVVTVFTLALDWLAPAVSAKAAGATRTSVAVSGLVGFVLLLTTGPLGFILGVTATVFLIEVFRTGEGRESLKAAVKTTAGILATTAVQVTVALAILVAFTASLVF